MTPGYEKRYRLEIESFSRYPNESRWNFRLAIYDTEHPFYSDDEAISTFDIDYTGDRQKVETLIHEKLQALANDSTLYKIAEMQEIISEYKGSKSEKR